ncbi:MAG: hypothetical protein BHV77_02270 [Bacteroides sp. 43_108]|nr:MAG: hypothetical protein BHV77_02270 [Bacteroides sp. 43_108]
MFRIYAFDRIKSVNISDIKFKFENDTEAEALFYDYYGIMLSPMKTERIVLRLGFEQGMHLKTLLFHH